MDGQKIKVFCDGGSRGNPGPAAAGVAVTTLDDQVIAVYHEYLGIQTNNYAEYSALILALKQLHNPQQEVLFYLDSMLVVQQIKGLYKVKNANIRPLYEQVMQLIQGRNVQFQHVPRAENTLADEQVNICLDNNT